MVVDQAPLEINHERTGAQPDDHPADVSRVYDVLIVGMGPVGKMAALQLARAGHSVLVAERKLTTYPLPRAVAHDSEIARILQNAGLAVDTIPDAVEPYDDMYVWVNAQQQILHQVDWTGIDSSGWNNTYFYNQPALEAHLDRRLREHDGVTVRRGVQATIRSSDSVSVSASLRQVDGGEEESVHARYVLGADGANSETRRSAGIEWTDLGYFFDWLVVDVIPSPQAKVTHLALQICDPSRPTTVVPGGPGRRRWEFMRLEGETIEELTRPERIWQLLEPFSVGPSNAQLERGVVYTFNSGWADRWRSGRVFLLGDAAHQMPPFAGQGLAAGLRDCQNLIWKLDRVLRGEALASLLDTYEIERLTHVKDFIDFSTSLGKIICILDPAEAAARDAVMTAELASGRTPAPPPSPRLGGQSGSGLYEGEHGGILSRQGRIQLEGGEPSRFDDVFGPGALILRHAGAVDGLAEEILALHTAGIVTTTFGLAAPGVLAFDDIDGTYGTWFDEWRADAVLVRPDFYVYGAAGEETDDLRTLIERFLERASRRGHVLEKIVGRERAGGDISRSSPTHDQSNLERETPR